MPHETPETSERDPAPVTLEVREHGIAWMTLGGPGEHAVLLRSAILDGLDARLSELEREISEQRARALVVCGARAGMFVAGSDVDELRAFSDPLQATRWALDGQRVLRRLEELPIPTIAAIDGPCLEGGLELALACAYRLASDGAATRLGLPQVRLGLIPFLGGTVRLPRLIGIQASLELILGGQPVTADAALQLGLVDEVLPARQFTTTVERFAEARVERGRIRTGARRRMPRRLLEDTAPGRRLVFTRAARSLVPRLEKVAPAARQALRTVADGVSLSLERAFQQEAEVAGTLIVSDRAQALLHALRLLQTARRTPSRASERPIERVGVLGAGAVGCELSVLLTSAHLPVLLKDRRRDALVRGERFVLDLLERERLDEAITAQEAHRRGTLVSTASGFGGFGTLDLVIAAVGYGYETTEEALREVEEHTRPDCVLACCSLTVSPSRLQEGMAHPERVIGLRFSRPAELFSLLEIVPGEATSQRTIDACRELARRLGRTPVIVPDRIDTPGNRLLGILFAEALRLLEEGSTVTEVDRAVEAFGFAMGPFRRMDAIGLHRCVRALDRLAAACGDRMLPSRIVERLTGDPVLFHRYRKGAPVGPNPVLPAGIPALGGGYSELIRTRLLLSLINEAALILEEQPSLSPGDIDTVALAGLGFPREQGGPLYHSDGRGLERVTEQMRETAVRFGDRFAPAPLLQNLAETGRSFYGPVSGQAVPDVLR